jgi:hypothetical protein
MLHSKNLELVGFLSEDAPACLPEFIGTAVVRCHTEMLVIHPSSVISHGGGHWRRLDNDQWLIDVVTSQAEDKELTFYPPGTEVPGLRVKAPYPLGLVKAATLELTSQLLLAQLAEARSNG